MCYLSCHVIDRFIYNTRISKLLPSFRNTKKVEQEREREGGKRRWLKLRPNN